jgi:hypothetical protein
MLSCSGCGDAATDAVQEDEALDAPQPPAEDMDGVLASQTCTSSGSLPHVIDVQQLSFMRFIHPYPQMGKLAF